MTEGHRVEITRHILFLVISNLIFQNDDAEILTYHRLGLIMKISRLIEASYTKTVSLPSWVGIFSTCTMSINTFHNFNFYTRMPKPMPLMLA